MTSALSSPAASLNTLNSTIVGAISGLNSTKTPTATSVTPPPAANTVGSTTFLGGGAPSIQNVTPSVSSTTLSNANKINQVVGNQNTLTTLGQKGITTDTSGNATNANGTQAKTVTATTNNPDGTTTQTFSDGSISTTGAPGTNQSSTNTAQPYVDADTSAEDTATKNIIDQLIATSDANTASTIQSIQSQFAVREQQQQIVNSANEAVTRNALLMGGVTGQGSSAQFAPISSSGVIQAQESYGIQQLASLDAQENSQIAAAKQAGYNNDFQAQEKLLNNINSTRQAKIDLATKLNDSIVQTNQTLAAQALQSNIDNGVATIYANGVTDPSEILKQLKQQGMNVSLDQINKSIQEIATRNGIDPTTLDATSKQFFYLKGIGGLPSSILGLPDTASQLAAYVQMVNSALATGKNNFSYGAGINPVVQTTLNLIGPSVSADMTVSQAIQSAGLPAIVDAVIGQEGGSPKGVDNNPGNIKSATAASLGIPYTDSGVKATDGGTFASFSTPQAGKDAVGAWIQKRGDTNIADAIASYKGVQNGASTVPGTTGSPTINTSQAGYSSQPVSGAGNLTQAAIDQKALSYVTSGTNPPVGRTGLAGQQNAAVSNRMAEIAPGANTAANKAQLKSLSESLATQQKYLDSTQRSVQNADAGFQQVVSAFKNKGINDQTLPIANIIANKTKYQLGDADLAAFNAGLQEVANEYTQVFSRGGTVSDAVRSKSSDIVNGNLSIDALQAVMNELQAQGKIVVDGAKGQVSSITSSINNIVAPGSSITATSHNGVNLPAADTSGGAAFNGISLPH